MKPIYFAQFYNRKLDGSIGEALASDSVLTLDGRMSLHNMEVAVYNQLERLKRLNKGFTGYSLHSGTYSNSRTIQAYKGFSHV